MADDGWKWLDGELVRDEQVWPNEEEEAGRDEQEEPDGEEEESSVSVVGSSGLQDLMNKQ
eukprot:SAG22_NODE_596_length_8727_cov_107.360338_3_plen_60_part_00